MASIGDMHGVDPKDATKLRKAGIRTTEALLRAGASRSGRSKLGKECGLPSKVILGLVNRADLMRVNGVGAEYADLLSVTGVSSVEDLATRQATSLLGALVQCNESKRLVRRLPTESMVGAWIEHGATIGSSVKP